LNGFPVLRPINLPQSFAPFTFVHFSTNQQYQQSQFCTILRYWVTQSPYFAAFKINYFRLPFYVKSKRLNALMEMTASGLNAKELREEQLVATGLRSVAVTMLQVSPTRRASVYNSCKELRALIDELREPPQTLCQRFFIAQSLCRIASRLSLADRRTAVDVWLLATDYYLLVLNAASEAAIVMERVAKHAIVIDFGLGLTLLMEASKLFERAALYDRAALIEEHVVLKAREQQVKEATATVNLSPLTTFLAISDSDLIVYDDDDDNDDDGDEDDKDVWQRTEVQHSDDCSDEDDSSDDDDQTRYSAECGDDWSGFAMCEQVFDSSASLQRTQCEQDLLAQRKEQLDSPTNDDTFESSASVTDDVASNVILMNDWLICDKRWFREREYRIAALHDRAALTQHTESARTSNADKEFAQSAHVATSIDGIGCVQTFSKLVF